MVNVALGKKTTETCLGKMQRSLRGIPATYAASVLAENHARYVCLFYKGIIMIFTVIHTFCVTRIVVQVLATGGDDRRVNVWALGKPNALMSLTGHTSAVECVTFDSQVSNPHPKNRNTTHTHKANFVRSREKPHKNTYTSTHPPC